MKYSPRPYQADTTGFVLANPKAAVLLDMGLGKTVSLLTAVEDLIDRCEISAVLVFGPLRVVTDTWADEAAKWTHTRKLKVSRVLGSERARIAALETIADIYVINYENMMWLAAYLHQIKNWPFQMVVYDESSMMKSPSSRRFKTWKIASHMFKRAVIMSGTPAPETYLNLWSQYYLLDGGARLGKFMSHFKDEHFRQAHRNSFTWELRDGSAKRIEDKVKDISICMQSEGRVELPELIVNDIHVELPAKCKALYKEFEREMIAKINGATTVLALSEAMKSGKCRQLTSGAVYAEDKDSDEEKPWTELHTAKIDALAEILEQMQGQPVIVLYEYRHEIERLLARWPKAPWVGGGSKNASATLARWNNRKMNGQPLFANPASIGHGLNLQSGGSTLIFLTTPWSSERYQQTIKRLHRSGQPAPTVVVHRLVCKGTVDEVVIRKQAGKYKSQAELARALMRG